MREERGGSEELSAVLLTDLRATHTQVKLELQEAACNVHNCFLFSTVLNPACIITFELLTCAFRVFGT